MERNIELTVRYASARMDSDGVTASIVVVTDHGRVTLRMHRIVLGGLAGAIARVLFPRVGDVPAAVEVPSRLESQDQAAEPVHVRELQDTADQRESQEPQDEALTEFDALWPKVEEPVAPPAEAEPHSVLMQYEADEPEGDSVAASAGIELQDVPTQHEADEPEGEAVATIAGAEPQHVLTQPESEAPEEQPVAASAGIEPHNIPTQPESAAPDGESVTASAGVEPHDIPTQPESQELERDAVAAFADGEPRNDPAQSEAQAAPGRKAIRPNPRRKKRPDVAED
jgi:hypothetical protein